MTEGSVGREDLRMISELLDGRLEGEERTDALHRIEGDEALYEVFVESARYRDARDARDARDVRGKSALLKFPGGKLTLIGGLLAAVLAVVVVLPKLRQAEPLASNVLAASLTEDSGLTATLGDRSWYATRWSATRGPTLIPSAFADMAFRAGVLGLDLDIALRARQSEAAYSLSERLAAELGDSSLGAGYAILSSQLENERGEESWRELRRVAASLAAWAEEDPEIDALTLTFGRWCEAGRLASASGNVELLTGEDFRQMVKRLIERGGWKPKVQIELDRLNDLLQEELNDLQVAAIGVSFEAILAEG